MRKNLNGIKFSIYINIFSGVFLLFCLSSCQTKEETKLSIAQIQEKMKLFWSKYTVSMQNNSSNFYARNNRNQRVVINSVHKWTLSNNTENTNNYYPAQKIGHWLVVENLTADNFPTLYYDFHNTKTPDYYFWYPIDFGAYILEHDTSANYLFDIDTILNAYTFGLENTKHTKFNYGKLEALKTMALTSVKNRKNEPFTIHSLKSASFVKDLKYIIDNSGCSTIQEINQLCQILQVQYNFSTMNPSARQYILSLDSLSNGQNFIRLWRDEEYKFETYEFLDNASFNKLELAFADYTTDNLSELKAYIQKTKPQLMYLKRNYRSAFNNEPYYYFIFYYIDFTPFMPPRLRDIEVVFPRRFGLS
jgi:hypothetical protein